MSPMTRKRPKATRKPKAAEPMQPSLFVDLRSNAEDWAKVELELAEDARLPAHDFRESRHEVHAR